MRTGRVLSESLGSSSPQCFRPSLFASTKHMLPEKQRLSGCYSFCCGRFGKPICLSIPSTPLWTGAYRNWAWGPFTTRMLWVIWSSTRLQAENVKESAAFSNATRSMLRMLRTSRPCMFLRYQISVVREDFIEVLNGCACYVTLECWAVKVHSMIYPYCYIQLLIVNRAVKGIKNIKYRKVAWIHQIKTCSHHHMIFTHIPTRRIPPFRNQGVNVVSLA